MKKLSTGILLNLKNLGDIDVIAKFLTYDFGMVSGLIKAGQTKKLKYQYQIGSIFSIEWFSRLPDQLGKIKANFINSYYHLIIDDVNRLELLICICNILNQNIIDNTNSNEVYKNTLDMIKMLCNFNNSYKLILLNYFLYEKSLLASLGFGFDLSKCTVNGDKNINNLKYISPTTARAVSISGGIGYEKKLFNMPEFFLINKDINKIEKKEFNNANTVLSYFMKKYIFINNPSYNTLRNRNDIIKKIIDLL